jgi:hypothetical protein
LQSKGGGWFNQDQGEEKEEEWLPPLQEVQPMPPTPQRTQGQVFLEQEIQRLAPQDGMQRVRSWVQTTQKIHSQVGGVSRGWQQMTVWGVEGKHQDKWLEDSIWKMLQ